MNQTIILTIIATIVAYRVLLKAASTGGAGSRREALGRLMGAWRRGSESNGAGSNASEGTAVALRRSGGVGEE